MPKVKNKDGSINWDEIKINPIINTTWGSKDVVNKSCKDVTDEIKAYIIKKQYNKLSNEAYRAYSNADWTRYDWCIGQTRLCEEILEFIDKIQYT